jgi:serine protease Do
MQLGSLDPQMRQRLGVQDGVIITSVQPGSAAAKSGLDRGDVIVAIGNKAVTNPADVAKEVASAEKAQARTVLLRIVNARGAQFVALPVGKA